MNTLIEHIYMDLAPYNPFMDGRTFWENYGLVICEPGSRHIIRAIEYALSYGIFNEDILYLHYE